MTLPELLALMVIVVAAPLSWLVAVLLWRLSRSAPDIRVLRADAVAALGLAILVSVFGLIFHNNGMQDPFFNTTETQVITRGMLLIASVASALYWLHLYRRGAP